MDCRELEKHVWAVAEANLPPDKKGLVEQHLARCDDCRTLADAVTALMQEAREANEIQASPFFFSRLKRRIEAHEAGRVTMATRLLPRTRGWKFVSVAACLTILRSFGSTNLAGVHLGDAVATRQPTVSTEIESEEFLFLATLDSVPHGSLAETLLSHDDGEEEQR